MKLRIIKSYQAHGEPIGFEFESSDGMAYVDYSPMLGISNKDVPVKLLIEAGYLEEVVEKVMPKPKFKVGDYAVVSDNNFKKISSIFMYSDGRFLYDGYGESELREPTKEELELYFR